MVRGERRRPRGRLGRRAPQQGDGQRRHHRRGHLPRRGRGREPHLRAVRHRARPVRRPRPRARPRRRARTTAGSPSCAPTAPSGAAVSRSCRSPLHSTTCSPRSAGQGLRPRRGDDPGDVDEPGAVPRPPLRPGVGAVPGPGHAGRHALRSRGQGLLRRPPRHLRQRGRLVAGPADVVHVVVRRVRALPAAEVRRHRGRLLVGAEPALVLGPALPRPQGRGEARRPRHHDVAERDVRPQLLHRLVEHQAARGRHALRDRPRQHAVGQRLPAPRGHLAEVARVAGEDLPRRTDRGDASDDRRGSRRRSTASTSSCFGRSPQTST